MEIAQVVLPAPLGVRPVPQGRVGELGHRRGLQPVVELGDLEQLEAQGRAAAVARQQRGGGRQATAGGAPAHPDASGVDTELGGVGCEPHQPGVAVVQTGGVRVLGGQAVLDRHDHGVDVGAVPLATGVGHGDRPMMNPPPWMYSSAGRRPSGSATGM